MESSSTLSQSMDSVNTVPGEEEVSERIRGNTPEQIQLLRKSELDQKVSLNPPQQTTHFSPCFLRGRVPQAALVACSQLCVRM